MNDKPLLESSESLVKTVASELRSLVNQTVTDLGRTPADQAGKFFPNGIDLIKIDLEVGADRPLVKIALSIAGKDCCNAASEQHAPDEEDSQLAA